MVLSSVYSDPSHQLQQPVPQLPDACWKIFSFEECFKQNSFLEYVRKDTGVWPLQKTDIFIVIPNVF